MSHCWKSLVAAQFYVSVCTSFNLDLCCKIALEDNKGRYILSFDMLYTDANLMHF